MAEVKATRGFQHGYYGTKEKGDKFDYPVTEDPHGLLADGFVERAAGGGTSTAKSGQDS
jgi:hypothetical protein